MSGTVGIDSTVGFARKSDPGNSIQYSVRKKSQDFFKNILSVESSGFWIRTTSARLRKATSPRKVHAGVGVFRNEIPKSEECRRYQK